MGLQKDEIKFIREQIDDCHRPLIYFHDDGDGIGSFLLLYRRIREGRGIIIKAAPKLDYNFSKKVKEFAPDKVFVVDIAMIGDDFLDEVKCPIIWIDHHTPSDQKRKNLYYFNPRLHDPEKNIPATELCYEIIDDEEELWIAMMGAVSDWVLPSFTKKFAKKYPDLMPAKKKPLVEDLLFDSRLGELIKVISFLLKGKTNDVMKCVKILTRIDDPYEILEQKTAQGSFLFKKYQRVNEIYEVLLEQAIKKNEGNDGFFFEFTYKDDRISFTKDMSNELLYKNPKKMIIIGREKDDEIRMSLRCSHLILPPILEKALEGVEGYGGGHEHACGCCVKKKDYEVFLKNLKKEVKEKT